MFTVGDRHLLVIGVEPYPEVFVEATEYVMGEVRMFNLEEVERELGVGLDDTMMRAFEGQPFILADSVEFLT